MAIPLATKEMIGNCLKRIPIKVDETYIKDFILNGKDIIRKPYLLVRRLNVLGSILNFWLWFDKE